jgi:hypothetical protein
MYERTIPAAAVLPEAAGADVAAGASVGATAGRAEGAAVFV